MFMQNIVCAVKVNGRILRESGDTVTLPFGAEFGLVLKNLNSVRAMASISIDGKDIADGERLILEPNSSFEIERFIRSGNMSSGNRFKFIERTAGIEDHRGIGTDDGLIRIEGWKEHVPQFVDVPVRRYYDEWVPNPVPYPYPYPSPWRSPWYPGPVRMGNQNTGTGSSNESVTACNFAGASAAMPTADRAPRSSILRSSGVRSGQPQQASGASGQDSGAVKFRSFDSEPERGDAGITDPGSESHQEFRHVQGFPLEPNSVVIVLRLRGEVGGKPAIAPITVNFKPSCETCGKSNKANSQFCSNCGTALVMI
jgi:hypothetical protein